MDSKQIESITILHGGSLSRLGKKSATRVSNDSFPCIAACAKAIHAMDFVADATS